jgi:CAAX protease family protein
VRPAAGAAGIDDPATQRSLLSMDARDPPGVNVDAAMLAFVAIAYALSIALSLVVGLTGGYESPLAGLRFLSMFIPAVAVLIVRSAMNEDVRIDWDRLPLKYIPVALLLLPAVLHAAMVPVAAAYEGRVPWEDWLTPQADGLYHTPPQRGWGALSTWWLVGRIAINAVVGVIVVSILAFFEEVGWRAWLLPRLANRMGARSAVIATAVIWAIWHMPFQLSGIQHIDGVSAMRLAFTAPLGIFGAGLVIGWLWVKTESIWIVSLAHGALNNWGEYAFKYMHFVRAPDSIVGGAGVVAVLVLGTLLLMRGLAPAARPG